MPNFTQEGRRLRATTTLGQDALIPLTMDGTEGVSRLFRFTVDFASERGDITAQDVLGAAVTMHVDRAGGEVRHINGIFNRFTLLGKDQQFFRYRGEIVPALWLATLWTDCRTFENMTTLDILKKVIKESGVVELRDRVTQTQETRTYVVQYHESNFAFVSRLMEGEGLHYRFEHEDGKHTMVITDDVGGTLPEIPGTLKPVPLGTMSGRAQDDTVYEVQRDFALQTKVYAIADHFSWRPDRTANTQSTLPIAKGERYEVVSMMGATTPLPNANPLIEIEEANYDVIRGKSSAPAIFAGGRTTLPEVAGSDVELHILEVTHHIVAADLYGDTGLEFEYENSFVGIPHSRKFRPPRTTPRPTMHGTQLAVIVGVEADGDIDVDKEGAVLLMFPWDRGAGASKGSKHRVHVASVWAGKSLGFVQHPRVGQEVLIEYIEGDMERPIVTGRVYNSSNAFPYPLPSDSSKSGWMSQSLKGDKSKFNELSFDDKQDSEKIFLHAQKDMEIVVLHDRTTTIKNNDTRTVEEGDDAHTVTKGKQTITIKADHTLTVQDGNHTVNVDKGNMTVKVAQGNIKMSADAGSISVEAAQKIELKVGANSITIDTMGVTIKGTNVKSEAQAQAEFKGALTKVDGSGMCEVHGGGMASLKSDGMAMVKGSITMIN